MHVLVTAGNTLVLIDRVRCLTNIFSGRTGAALALCAHGRGHAVTLLTSHPEAVGQVRGASPPGPDRWTCLTYRTFADLDRALEAQVRSGRFDVVIHCAAVSDYESAGVYAAAPGTTFDPAERTWHAGPGAVPQLADRAAGKVKSDEPELWLRLVRAPKLIDRVREPWGFTGILVKFKLEVDVTEEQLVAIAERSRRHSRADWMVANTLDGAPHWASLGSAGGYERLARRDLPTRLLDAVEGQHRGAGRG